MADPVVLSVEMALVLFLLATTVYLFAFAVVRVDVAALLIMVFLGLFAHLPGIDPLLTTAELFSGFSSNAVISIIAVMIIGRGLDKTGLMMRLAQWILQVGGKQESRISPLISAIAAFASSFMQNVGVAALFLPVVSRVATRSGIPISRLLMPVGFCIILGGTATMIGSSPLIVLNDLLLSSNRQLADTQQMQQFGLFAVLPIGVALSLTGLLYFALAGRFILPRVESGATRTTRTDDYFESVYGIRGELLEARVTDDSPMVGMTLHQVEETYDNTPFMLALYSGDVVKIPPDPEETLWVNTRLGLMGDRDSVAAFCHEHGWSLHGEPERFAEVLNSQHSGIGEIVVPPSSSLVGQAIGDIKPRRSFGTNIMKIYRAGDIVSRGFRDFILQAGDTLVVHASWKDLHKLKANRDLVVASDVKYEDIRNHKLRPALIFFGLSLLLFLITDTLSISLLAGAIGMILSGVLTVDEAYESINLPTVFLLASLIPLGVAMDHSGAALWISLHLVSLIGDVPNWVMQTVIAVLATFFSLLMSNVGATVLLVPLAVNIAISIGADPAIFALTVAISASNAFLIPTNQVNALIMGPGGYSVADFMRVGGVMSILYLLVSLLVMNVVMGA